MFKCFNYNRKNYVIEGKYYKGYKQLNQGKTLVEINEVKLLSTKMKRTSYHISTKS